MDSVKLRVISAVLKLGRIVDSGKLKLLTGIQRLKSFGMFGIVVRNETGMVSVRSLFLKTVTSTPLNWSGRLAITSLLPLLEQSRMVS
jgi:hypothetical protein